MMDYNIIQDIRLTVPLALHSSSLMTHSSLSLVPPPSLMLPPSSSPTSAVSLSTSKRNARGSGEYSEEVATARREALGMMEEGWGC